MMSWPQPLKLVSNSLCPGISIEGLGERTGALALQSWLTTNFTQACLPLDFSFSRSGQSISKKPLALYSSRISMSHSVCEIWTTWWSDYLPFPAKFLYILAPWSSSLRVTWDAASWAWSPKHSCQIKHNSPRKEIWTIWNLKSQERESHVGLIPGSLPTNSLLLELVVRGLCCWSVPQSCLTLHDPVDCSMPGFPVLHCLLKFAQIWVNDTI